eukprot:TRINITY_DN287_c0_g1_i2.p2 TRINITY_DN287_c0_g1~~TRINITY_DN287_c0_g1_i2.p2  ORF type:complete len:157 (+),score=7.39 TRINITY_DN287_c0_g1_i2:83-553(+)
MLILLLIFYFYCIACLDPSLQLSCVSKRKTIFGRSLLHVETPNKDSTKYRTQAGCECMSQWQYMGKQYSLCTAYNQTSGWCFAFPGSCQGTPAGIVNVVQPWDWCNCVAQMQQTTAILQEDVNFCTDREDWVCQYQNPSRECFYFDPRKELNLVQI